MKNLIPHDFNELMALSVSTLAVVAWMILWWQA